MGKPRRMFDARIALAEAKAGRLSGRKLQKAIRTAEQFGNSAAASELELYRIQPTTFADDRAPKEARERLAQGLSVLLAMGESLSRTIETLKKRGAMEVIVRKVRTRKDSKNFDLLRRLGKEHLSAEAVVIDYQELFDPRLVAIAQKRLRTNHVEAGT